MEGFFYQVFLFFQGIYLDVYELIKGTDFFVALLCFLLCLGLFGIIDKRLSNKLSISFVICCSLYFTFLLSITLFGRESTLHSSADGLFKTYTEAFSGNASMQFDILFNIFLYVPVGILVFRYKKVLAGSITVCLLSLIIEFIQLITNRGIFEVSDIINNLVGGLIGLGMAWLVTKLFGFIKIKRKGDRVERAE